MQYWNFKNNLLTFIFSFPVLASFAQENSPYSRYGVGNLKQTENISNRGMGGVSVADDNPLQANPINPATYTGIRMTSLQIGLEGSRFRIRNNNGTHRTGSSTLSYINIGFPVAKNAGISFGLLPQTRSAYNMQKYNSLPGIDDNALSTYFGGGGLQKVYIGGAYKYQQLSIGLNTGYNFGSIQNSTTTEFTDSLDINSSNFSARTIMGGFFWQLGLLYTHKINEDMSLKGGVSYTGAQSLRAKKEMRWESYRYDITDPYFQVDSVVDAKGKIQIPGQAALGLMLSQGDYWQVGADLSMSDWSNFRSYEQADSFGKQFMFKFGGAITPDINSVNNYWERMTFRAGVYTGQDLVRLNGTSLSRSGITVGLGYPIRRTNNSIGQLNAVLEFGKRGTLNNGLVREGYTRFAIGFTVNDKWFIKRKYD
jgi:hypothetical protein